MPYSYNNNNISSLSCVTTMITFYLFFKTGFQLEIMSGPHIHSLTDSDMTDFDSLS